MRGLLAIATFLALFAFCATVSRGARPAYLVIVNPNKPLPSVDRQFLADAFLKKATTWSNGEGIRPVDLPPGSPVRRQFTDEILHRSISEVKGYWQQRIFSGRDVPPPELDSDEAVVAYVLRYDGAVGYVSGDAALNGAKTVLVR
jgi:ABC-type phosphate transport system substrate-binding protein